MKILNRLFNASDKYLKKSTWIDMALLKFCLCAIGILIGLHIPCQKKKNLQIAAALIFISTYIPLMAKFLPILADEFKD